MIRSMTGFGQADGAVGTSRVSVEVRTVNHRFFSPSIKLPNAFSRWETDVRDMMRLRVSRGHVTLMVRLERADPGGAGIDEARFAAVVAQLRALQERHQLDGGVDLAAVLRMPDVIATAHEEEAEPESLAELLATVERALDALARMREDEGGRLATILRTRLDVIASALQRIAARVPERVVAHRDRLRTAVRELTDGLAVDENRLAQEIAILSDKLDVSEELDRFGAHIAAFHAALAENPEPVGKRLGFLLQEMLREANTTGSKGADATILHEVVTVKEELERIREQVENLE